MRRSRHRAPRAAVTPFACLLLAVGLVACGQGGVGSELSATASPIPGQRTATSSPVHTPAPLAQPSTAAAMTPVGEADGPGRAVPEEAAAHVPVDTSVEYANELPTSGKHYPAWAEYGVYQEAIPAPYFVHNLEHGAIVVLYRCPDGGETCPEVVSRLEQVYAAAPPGKYGEVKMVVTQYPELETPYAVLAWNRILPLEEIDQDAILEFYRAWVDRGPEDVP